VPIGGTSASRMRVTDRPRVVPVDCTCFTSVQYTKRVFSVRGMLSQGRRNRVTTSLEMRVRLKLNAKALA